MNFDQDILRVSSPVARDIVVRLYRIARSAYVDPDSDSYLKTYSGENHLAYRSWVKESLEQSDLITRLMDSESQLPDISSALPPAYRAVQGFFAPRKVEAVLLQLVRNLDWYLDPERPLLLPSVFYKSLWAWSTVFLLTVCLQAFIKYVAPAYDPTNVPITAIVSGLGLLVMLIVLCIGGGNPLLSGHVKTSITFQINAVEFYRYALEQLSDPLEVASHPQVGMPSGELASSGLLIERAGKPGLQQ